MGKRKESGEEKMKDIPFEKALGRLEEIVGELEAGDLSLDASLERYEEGIMLARKCQEKLDKAKARIETLVKKDKGRFEVGEFKQEGEG